VVGDDVNATERVEAVIFDFSNSFSWMTGKDVELVALQTWPSGPLISAVPPLLSLRPHSKPPRPRGNALAVSKPYHTGKSNGVKGAVGIDAVTPELRVELATGKTSPNGEQLVRLAGFLDAFLAAAEDKCLDSSADCEWLTDLRHRIGAVRAFCREGPPPASVENFEQAVQQSNERDASQDVPQSIASDPPVDAIPTDLGQDMAPTGAAEKKQAEEYVPEAAHEQQRQRQQQQTQKEPLTVPPTSPEAPVPPEPLVPAWKLEPQWQQRQQQQDRNWWTKQLQQQQQEQREEDERQRQQTLQREMQQQQQQQQQHEADPLERAASVTGLRALFEKNKAVSAHGITALTPHATTAAAAGG
jgi:hypothetical protein